MKEKEENKSVFLSLNCINVNDKTETKDTGGVQLTYLSWPFAWGEVVKRYPDASYEVVKDENGRPYFADEDYGLMCMTNVTIEGKTLEMWLPVMDGANKAMKRIPYTYKVWNRQTKQWTEKTVAAATMFDINKTIMRCLVKNLAMFGLGLYIYSGEDLPEIETEKISIKDANILKDIIRKIDDGDKIYTMILNRYKVKSFRDLTQKQRSDILAGLQEISKKGISKESGNKI